MKGVGEDLGFGLLAFKTTCCPRKSFHRNGPQIQLPEVPAVPMSRREQWSKQKV